MQSTLTLLVATTAVIGALGLPALSAIGRDPGTFDSAVSVGNASDGTVILAGNDDDSRKASRRDTDDQDDEDDDCDDDDDEDECRRSAPAPALTGPVTPPTNGLFSPGAVPQVRTK